MVVCLPNWCILSEQHDQARDIHVEDLGHVLDNAATSKGSADLGHGLAASPFTARLETSPLSESKSRVTQRQLMLGRHI